MTNYLYPPTQPPPPLEGTTTGGWGSNEFYVASSGHAVGSLGWYRYDTTGLAPSQLRLRDLVAGSDVVTVTAPDDGTVGWHYVDLTTPYPLVANNMYAIGGIEPGGVRVCRTTGITPDAPFIFERHNAGGTWYISGGVGSSISMYSVGDATVSTGDNPTAGTTSVITVAPALDPWLSGSASVNTHQTDGLPWLTKTVADAIKVVTDKLGHSGSGNSLDWITALWRLAGDLTDAEIGYLKSLLDKQGQIVGGSGGGGSAFYGPSGTQVAEGVETLLAQGVTPTDLGAAVALLRERLDLSPDLSDTTRWTLVDTIEGSADALVNVQADAYFFNLTTIPSEHPHLGVAATLWVPRWGWTAPRVHAHFRQRQFTDIFPALFTADGLFMDGLLIHALPGFEWTCECYMLDRS